MNKVEQLRTDINRLRDRGFTWVYMYDESGVDRTWIQKFAAGLINEPTVTRYDVLKTMVRRLKKLSVVNS